MAEQVFQDILSDLQSSSTVQHRMAEQVFQGRSPLAAPKDGAVLAAAGAPPKEKLLLLLPAKYSLYLSSGA